MLLLNLLLTLLTLGLKFYNIILSVRGLFCRNMHRQFLPKVILWLSDQILKHAGHGVLSFLIDQRFLLGSQFVKLEDLLRDGVELLKVLLFLFFRLLLDLLHNIKIIFNIPCSC